MWNVRCKTYHISCSIYSTVINRGTFLLFLLFFGTTNSLWSQVHLDSVINNRPTFIHRLEIEGRPGYIIPTNPFLKGENEQSRPIRYTRSSHLKYSFQFHPDNPAGQIYRGAYQGIGFAYYSFDNYREIGDPKAAYLFQGATLFNIGRRLSFDYEWNFGLSTGWNPYDYEKNPYNGMVGSKINAYMNMNFYFRQFLSRHFDLIYGITFTHFSNGNTKFPNAGLNATDLKAGISYNINRQQNYLTNGLYDRSIIRNFPRHISYDIVFFGSWRRKGIVFNDEPMASPDKYTVLGFNINPMYNLGYKLRVGASVDGVYDSSANIYTENYIIPYGDPNPGYTFYKPALNRQLALGVSARAEYVMPYFDVGLGIGANVLHRGGDLKGLYQILALKIKVTRHSFIHIGYNLQNFDTPNYLMLGFGLRMNNKSPQY